MSVYCRAVGDPRRRRGRGWLWLVCLLVALVQPAFAQSTDTPRHGLAVMPPRSEGLLAPLAPGTREWLHVVLAQAGVDLVARDQVSAASKRVLAGERSTLHGSDAPALAAATSAAVVLLSELRDRDGQAEVRLRLHDGTDGSVVSASAASGRTAEFGLLLKNALVGLLDPVGVPPETAAAEPAPSLDELAVYGRTLEAIDALELVRAWRELKGRSSRTAESLRAEIVRVEGSSPKLNAAERSRLATLRGERDHDWLKVREALVEGRDPVMMVAGADSALSRARADRALELYGTAARLDARNHDAQLGRAELLAAGGRTAEAALAYRAAMRLRPKDPGAYEKLAGLPELAAEERARLLVQAGNLRAERLEFELARRAYRAAGQLERSIAVPSQVKLAELQERIGNHSEAALAYQQALELDPNHAEALAGLGRSRRHLDDLPGAEQALLASLAQRPQDSRTLASLGAVLVEAKRPREAIPHLEQAVALEPSSAQARHSLARAHRASGDPEAALQVLGSDAVAASNRPVLLREASEIQASQGRLDEAEETLQQAIAIEPEDPDLHKVLAELYEAKGDAAAAEAQRLLATSLGWEMQSPDGAGAAPGSEPSGGVAEVVADFNGLIASFPVHSPKTRKPIGRVMLLGLVEELDWKGHIRQWLVPRVPDHTAIEDLLIRSILERYELTETPRIPADLANVVADLSHFSTDSEKIALLNDMLGIDAAFAARLSRTSAEKGKPAIAVEVRLLGGRTSEGVFILTNAQLLQETTGVTAWNWKALAPTGLVLLLLLLPVIRGWGTLVVTLDYESIKGTKGFFNVKLSTKPEKVKKEKANKSAHNKDRVFQRRVRSWSRYARNMVGKETRFRMLPSRSYYVGVHGLLQDAVSKEVIGNYIEEKKVQIERGRVAELTFDFRPKETSLEVRLIRPQSDGAPGQAMVALRGRPDSMRYVREESALLYVDKGTHHVVVAYGDRVFEQEIKVEELEGLFVSFVLSDDQGLLFSGCPEAVEPYVNGDLNAASTVLAYAGQTEVANLIRGEYYRQRGEKGRAAVYLQAAGRLTEAAELVEDADHAGHSANLYLQAGDYQKAAERFEQIGEHLKAAEAYESAYSFNKAIEAYRRADQLERVIDLVERTGDYLEAAQVAIELGQEERAIRDLQAVDARDVGYGEACRALADIFARREEFDLAVQKAEDAVAAFGDEAAPLEIHDQLGDLLERADRPEDALRTFEFIRKRNYQYQGVGEKIESLRARLSERKQSVVAEAPDDGATQVASPPRESRYELLEEIGRGGMGVVFKARDRRLGRVVALKRLPDNLRDHPTAVQLFLREARAAAALNHQNIVTLFDADQENDNYYITMELLEGLPFDAILKKRAKLTARDTVRLGVQVAAGLQYAHEQRVVHRDIKTANLYFTKDRTVKIMDFGLAKMIEEVRRSTTVVGGTPYYMAPEQAAGDSVDHRADLYAFGVTLFELLTGRVPFGKGDVTYHHRHSVPPDPRSYAPELPGSLADLVLRLMAKNPDERFQTTAEVRSLLGRIAQSLQG